MTKDKIIDGLKAAIAAAQRAGNTEETQRLQDALEYQLETSPHLEAPQAPQRQDPPSGQPWLPTRNQASAARAGHQLGRSATPSTYNRDHCLAAHQARTRLPPANASLEHQLEWLQHERNNAGDWAEAFELRASSNNTAEGKAQDEKDRDDWRTHRDELNKQLRRLRDAQRYARSKH